MNRITIVQAIIRRLKAQNYIEVGVSKGHAFLALDVKNKIAIDPLNQLNKHVWKLDWDVLNLEFLKAYRFLLQAFGFEKARFFEMTSDDFFKREKVLFDGKSVDVAFIDGLHSYGQALRDVQNCLEHLGPHGVIVLHDCNPISAPMETPAESFDEAVAKNKPDWNKLWCGDVWKVIVNLRSLHKDLKVFVLDCDMGIGVVARGTSESMLPYSSADIDRLSYKDLERERERFLNLKPVSYFETFINSLPKV